MTESKSKSNASSPLLDERGVNATKFQKSGERKLQIQYLLIVGVLFHLIYSVSIFDIYFRSPLVHGMEPVEFNHSELKENHQYHSHMMNEDKFQINNEDNLNIDADIPPAKRLVLIVADGLRADKLYENRMRRAPFLRKIVETKGKWGVSHTHVPTESRPGHVALIAGFYEDVSAVTKGWKLNPVNFDSVFNQSRKTWSFGSPDILPMFSIGASDPDRVLTFMYDSDEEDFGKDASQLDTWVFEKVNALFRSAAKDQDLYRSLNSDKIIFFLHLLGLDTNGHAFKPYSQEYLNNINLVDKGLEMFTDMLEEFYRHDNQTAYVFTADHGMSNIGNHGDGHPDNTRTPLITWGAGILPPKYEDRNLEDPLEDGWKLNDLERIDVEQGDIAPLMSSLIGIPYPMNSVGVLPKQLLNNTPKFISRALFRNAVQINRQFLVKEDQKRKSSILFQPYNNKAKDLNLKSIEKLILQGQYEKADILTAQFIQWCLDGLRYYQTYDWLFLRSIITAGYVGWMGYCSLFFFEIESQKRNSISIISILSAIIFSLLLFYQRSPIQYYAYVFFPIFFFDRILQSNNKCMTGLLKWNQVVPFLSFVLLLEILVGTYFYRELLTPLMHILAFLWPWDNSIKSKKIQAGWRISCLALSIFTVLPADKEDNVMLVVAGGACILISGVVGSFLLSNDKQNFVQLVDGLQVMLLAFSIVMVYITDSALKNKQGLPPTLQTLNIIISSLSFSNLFFVKYTAKKPVHRLYRIYLSFAPIFMFLSISFEVLFYFVYSQTLLFWLLMNQFNVNNDKPNIISLASIYLIFINVSFFGTGNMASVSSFNLDSVYRFVTVFSPFIMTALLVLKILVPFFLLSCTLSSIANVLGKSVYIIFLFIVSTTDIMTLNFFYLVKDDGSWLEIGTTISHFVIASVFIVFQMILFFVGQILVGKPYGKLKLN